MSFLRFLTSECLRKSCVCMFRCNWTCLVRRPGSILSAGLRAHGPALLTCWHRMAGNVAIAKPCCQQWHHHTLSLSAEEATPLDRDTEVKPMLRMLVPLLRSSLLPSWTRQLTSSILLEAKGGHVIQFWPIKHKQKFTEQPLGMVGFPGKRDGHELALSTFLPWGRHFGDWLWWLGVGEPRESLCRWL